MSLRMFGKSLFLQFGAILNLKSPYYSSPCLTNLINAAYYCAQVFYSLTSILKINGHTDGLQLACCPFI